MNNSDFFACELIGGRYRCVKSIGSGGMSEVFLAFDTHIGKEWAVKLIDDRGESEKLSSEIDTLKALDYPMFPRITDAFRYNGRIAIVTDYIEGETLEHYLSAEGALAVGKALDYFSELLKALSYLHGKDKGILYLDMKPSNIMVTEKGDIKLIDFGIAASILTKSRCYGSAGYAPPEQYRTDAVLTEKADVFALGMTLYSMVSARAPDENLKIQRSIIKKDRNVPVYVRKLILKCTEPDLRRRPSVHDLLDETVYRENRVRRTGTLIATVMITAVVFTAAILSVRSLLLESKRDRYAEEMIEAASVHMADGEYTCEGIRIICGYIDGNFLNDEIRSRYAYEVAKYYFEIKRDYSLAKHYFKISENSEYPEAEYYEKLCEYMVSFTSETEEVGECLRMIERINSRLPQGRRKDSNNELIDFIYSEIEGRQP